MAGCVLMAALCGRLQVPAPQERCCSGGASCRPAARPPRLRTQRSSRSLRCSAHAEEAAAAEAGAEPGERAVRKPPRPPAARPSAASQKGGAPKKPRLQPLIPVDPPGHKSGYVAIVGLPNAGKSTLLNALVGQKLAIVTAKPQTTRHRILGILSGPGHQGLLVDTPGVLATSRTALDGAMMRTVRSVLTQADVLCVVVDGLAASADPASGLEGLALTGAEGGPPLCVLLNKADLLGAEAAEQLRSWYAAQPGVAAVLTASAKLGTGVRELEAWLVGSLPPGPTLYPKDQVSEHPERFFVAECVREQIFELYRQEVPYCTSVSVLEHREGRNGQKDFIRVQVSVERESQKPILLGKGGAAIKQLSSASRAAVEDFLQRPVFLDLTVKVAEGWRDSEELLESFGVTNASRIV